MNQPSAFQAQYPLSPRKFWKKILDLVPTFLFYIIMLGIPIFVYSLIAQADNHTNINYFSFIWLFIGICILQIMIAALYIKAYIRRYYYDCSEQFITIKKGVFTPTEIHVQYQKIQDVYVDQDIYDRMFGLYDVHIASATVTSGIEAHIDGVDQNTAESIKNYLLNKIKIGSNPGSQTQPVTTAEAYKFNSSQKISSQNYPIQNSWLVVAWVQSFISTLSLFLFLNLILTPRHAPISFPGQWQYVAFLIVFLLLSVRQVIWKNNFYFEFMEDHILFRSGVFNRRENHLPYKSIQNIINKQGFVERIFGLATLSIQNAAQGGAYLGENIPGQPKASAEELNQILNDIVSKINPQNSSAMGV